MIKLLVVVSAWLLLAVALALNPTVANTQQLTAVNAKPTCAQTNPAAGETPCLQPQWRIVANEGYADSKIQALASNDVWLAAGLIKHFDGSYWTNLPDAGINFSAVAVGGPDSIWGAGAILDPSGARAALFAQWDGSAWQNNGQRPGASQGAQSPDLYHISYFRDIVAFSPDEFFVVGDHDDDSYIRPMDKYCKAGTCISPETPPYQTLDFEAVDGVNAADLWIGGSSGFDYTISFIAHWDGTAAMTQSDTPDVGRIASIGAASSDDVWAIGENGIIHWDGQSWSQAETPAPLPLCPSVWTDYYLPRCGIDARASDDAWAVGSVMQHWDGVSWQVVYTPTAPLSDVSIAAENDVWGIDIEGNVWHYSSPAEFTDVQADNPFYPYIHCLACREALGGYADGTFKWTNNVTRGQMAKIVSNAVGYTETYTIPTFSDVAPADPFFQSIERLAHHSIIGGYADGTFRPGNDLTRAQAAKVVANAAGYAESYSAASFSDVPTANPFFQYIERLAHHGIIGGYADGTFRPDNQLTRGQAAKLASRGFFPDCQPGNAVNGEQDKQRSGK